MLSSYRPHRPSSFLDGNPAHLHAGDTIIHTARLLTRVLLSALALTASWAAPAGAQSIDENLTEIRQTTEKYKDVEVAVAEGYVNTVHCISAPMLGLPAEVGSMGVHFAHPGLLGITAMEPRATGTDAAIDWMRPEVLLYEPQPDGTFELIGIEYLVFESAWKGAGNVEPPGFHGTLFPYMIDDPATPLDEAHAFEPHYELHVWTVRDNPTGLTAEFNPAVTCAAAPEPAAPADEHATHDE